MPAALLALLLSTSAPRTEPEAAVRALVTQLRPALEACYEHGLKRGARSGEIVLALSVSRSGRWRGARVAEASRGQAAVGRCMARRLRESRLPPLSSSARLEVPIRLQPKG
jgi:hypothetical protein